MKYLPILFAMLVALPAWGQPTAEWPASGVIFEDAEDLQTKLPTFLSGGAAPHRFESEASLPTCSSPTWGDTIYIEDATDSADCATGTPGTVTAQCFCDDNNTWTSSNSGGGGSGEINTHSSEAGGISITATEPKVTYDLRLVNFIATDFDRTGDSIYLESDVARTADLHSIFVPDISPAANHSSFVTEVDARIALQDHHSIVTTIVELDTTTTGAELTELTDTTDADHLHTHASGGAEVNDLSSVVTWANIPDGNVPATHSGSAHHAIVTTIVELDTTTTGAELTELTDTTDADHLHAHASALTSEANDLSASVTWTNIPDANVPTTHSGSAHHTAFTTGDEVNNLATVTWADIPDGNVPATHSGSAHHSIVTTIAELDTTTTGSELTELTDTTDADHLHTHASGGPEVNSLEVDDPADILNEEIYVGTAGG